MPSGPVLSREDTSVCSLAPAGPDGGIVSAVLVGAWLVVESYSNLRKLMGRGRAFSPMNEIQALAQILHPMTANYAALAPASSQMNIVVVLNDT